MHPVYEGRMLLDLVTILATMSSNQLAWETALGAAVDVHEVALEEKPILHVNCSGCKTTEQQEALDAKASACLVTVWFYRESRFDPKAVGDNGTSFGVPQLKASHAALTEVSLEDIRTNRKESIRAGWRLLRIEIKRCGSVLGGLGAYASGKCGGAQEKVKHRMKLAESCWKS
jgi:hypothetical protein